jgi:hypothetical protein
MECIFLEEETKCTAHLPQFAPFGVKMDEDTLKRYCKTAQFDTCPRYKSYMEYEEKHSKK